MRFRSKIATAILLLLGAAGFVVIYEGMLEWDEAHGARLTTNGRDSDRREALLIDVAGDRADSFKVTAAGLKSLDIQTQAVEPAPRPEPLRLPGSLLLDANRLVRVHARFSGELVSLGQVPVDNASPTGSSAEQRSLRYGDKVSKGQLLGVVWCKDLGEKKSELVDALSRAKIDHNVWDRLAHVEKGAIPQRTIDDAQLAYESDLVAVAKAERTLRSWRLIESEIKEVHSEAERIGKLETNDAQADRTWAETEVRSPISGIIVEKNFNVGDIMDPSQDLFKIADLSYLQVLASAYEEDLPQLRSLRPDQQIWEVDVKADPHDVPIKGKFEMIGSIIDPQQHAGAVIGWIPNPDSRLSAGEFITATIELPADPSLVAVPTSALIEEGGSTRVFVETDAAKHEFTSRKIAVVKRGRERAWIRAVPLPQDERGTEPLSGGERVITSGALELAAEMKSVHAAARERRSAVLYPSGRVLLYGPQAH